MIKQALLTIAALEALVHIGEVRQRQVAFAEARQYADSVGKPLLVVGTPRFGWLYHPCGDVTIDNDPFKAKVCNTEVADVRAIPYADQYFGSAFASHVIEHLPTVVDAHKALDELHRVAEKVFVVVPHKISLLAWISPGHHLWVTPDGDDFIIEQRNKRPSATASCITLISAMS